MSFQIYNIKKRLSVNTFIVCTKKDPVIPAGILRECLFLAGRDILQYESNKPVKTIISCY